jgi:putative tRNA adenosine deaminase-associated protein
LGLVSLDEDTAVIVRINADDLRVVMSDPTASEDYDLAAEVADLVGPGDDEIDDDAAIAGDSALLADLGMPASELELLFDDLDLYPDEMLEAIADRLGFVDDFRRARDDSTA